MQMGIPSGDVMRGRISGKENCKKSFSIKRVGLKRRLLIFITLSMTTIILCNFTEEVSYNTIKITYKIIIDRGETIIMYDEQGVPYVDYGYDDGVFIGRQRNPVTISQKGLAYIGDYRNGYENSRQYFINCADWLLRNSVKHNGFSILEYTFPWPKYNMTPPWRSAMAQGQAVQFLANAHEQTQKKEYLIEARNLLNAFFIEVSNGGVTLKSPDKGWWYEEYAHEYGMTSMVLNGMMFAILGIHDYYQYTKENDAKYLFDQGVLALEKELPEYDHYGDSYYDILKNPSGVYHNTHVRLLDNLYEITGNDVFLEYHNRWQDFDDSPFIVKLICNPIPMRLAILLMNFMLLFLVLKTFAFLQWSARIIRRKDIFRSGHHLRQRILNGLVYFNRYH
jgi:hypothetical protein